MTRSDFLAFRQDRLHMTQAELAAALDLSRMTVSRYESGARPVPRVVALALSALMNEKGRSG